MRKIALFSAFFALGCGNKMNNFEMDSGGDDGSVDDSPIITGDGNGGDGSGCVNLQCQQVQCGGGMTTSLSGTVVTGGLAMYGKPDPVYNAIVYVPNQAVQPFTPGVACDKCGTPVSGNPVVVTLTDVNGKFKLDDVPVGMNIPLVVQVGRWRRQVTIANVPQCVDTPLTADQTRLPRKKSEGDIPHIAIASSTYDVEECILLKMGVDQAEFTDPTQNGRIHIYHGNGTTIGNAPDKSLLTASVNTLKQYDVTLFPCSSVPSIGSSPGQDGVNLQQYLDVGGRAFVTDLSYSWFKDGPMPWPGTAQWTTWGGTTNPLPATIDMTFPKGKALAQWLQNIGATTMLGQISLQPTYHVVDGVNAPTTRWLYSTSPVTVQSLSFNTPVGKQPGDQCGRAVYSNFHVAAEFPGGGSTFPAECTMNPMTPQEKAMEFMFLDLSSCVMTDTMPPMPPPK